jgi:hypothetical protein
MEHQRRGDDLPAPSMYRATMATRTGKSTSTNRLKIELLSTNSAGRDANVNA